MFKVLVAIANKKDVLKYYNILSNNSNFEVFTAYTGIDALNKYYEIYPDIFILDYGFSDINGTEILKKIEMCWREKEKINTIFIAETDKSNQITNVSKIYKIIYTPYKTEDVINAVNQFVEERKCPKPNLDDIYSYFSDFKMHLSINGCEYMKSAIDICLQYFPFYGRSLDDLLDKLAEKYQKTPEQIRDGLKSALKPINISSQEFARNLYPQIFNDDDLLSPRKFIERSTIYFYKQQKKK